MDKERNIPSIRKEEVIKDIAELKAQIDAVQSELHAVGNEEKVVNYKKGILEARKDDLNGSIEFYKNKAKKTRHSLSMELAKHSKFSMADVCYTKLLEVYRENYLKTEPLQTSSDVISDDQARINLDPQKQIEVLQKQIEDLKIIIEENSKTMSELLDELQY